MKFYDLEFTERDDGVIELAQDYFGEIATVSMSKEWAKFAADELLRIANKQTHEVKHGTTRKA